MLICMGLLRDISSTGCTLQPLQLLVLESCCLALLVVRITSSELPRANISSKADFKVLPHCPQAFPLFIFYFLILFIF